MNDKVSTFCDGIHEKLASLEGRIDALKLNVGSTWHSLQAKLEEALRKGEATSPSIVIARVNLEHWFNVKRTETREMIDQLVKNREMQKLAIRAQTAEECAGFAIDIANASIDDAERMVLEAISARRLAEPAGVNEREPVQTKG